MLQVTIPATFPAERDYAVDVVLRHFLGLEVEVDRAGPVGTVAIGDGDKRLVLDDVFFAGDPDRWLSAGFRPSGLAGWWTPTDADLTRPLASDALPVVFGASPERPDFLQVADDAIRLRLDVFGTVFFMLTRYEELDPEEGARDERGRYTAAASLAGRHGFLDRPIADEYCEILWALIQRLWPGTRRRPRRYSLVVSHDVDRPYQRRVGFVLNAGGALRDLMLHGQLARPLLGVASYFQPFGYVAPFEPYNTFGEIMRLSEERGLTSTFFFMNHRSPDPIDADYDLEHPWIRKLIAEIHRRGHEVGVHPSYRTWRDGARIRREAGGLKAVAREVGVQQQRWGSRQHYLRFEVPTTWQHLEDAGIDYDSTLSFHDRVGFRCGTCRPYPVFNLRTRTRLAIVERPLVAMEATLMHYMGLDGSRLVEQMIRLARQCRKVEGELTLLWHNSTLITPDQRRLYTAILDVCS
jgi:Family of unknown function (DUF7033)